MKVIFIFLKLINKKILLLHLVMNEEATLDANVYDFIYYVFQGRVTLFFADKFSTECRITMEFLHNFF